MEEARDAKSFHEFEYAGWEESVDEYDSHFSPLTQQTIAPMVAAIGPASAKRVLDVACGPGDLSRSLAEQGASVTAVDFSPAMLERARAQSPGFEIEFRLDDAQSLSTFDDDTFDAVVMNYGILHLGQPSLAVHAAARVLKPGGRFAFSCWQEPSRARGFALILDAVQELGAKPDGVPHGPNFFMFSDNANIETAFAEEGFTNVTIRDVDQTWELEDSDALFAAFLHGTARTGGMLRRLSSDDRESVKRIACKTADELFATPEGTLSIPMPAKVASAEFAV